MWVFDKWTGRAQQGIGTPSQQLFLCIFVLSSCQQRLRKALLVSTVASRRENHFLQSLKSTAELPVWIVVLTLAAFLNIQVWLFYLPSFLVL